MAVRINFTILPIHRSNGQDQPGLPGIYTTAAPRQAARSRKNDHLIVTLILTGTATFAAEGQQQLMEGIARTYFGVTGAATSALRAAAESFNEFLLDRNLRSASSGLQATGLLTLVAFHRERFYIAQSGDTHIFTVTDGETQHFHDPYLSGRGLGLSKAAAIRYMHVPADPGSLIIISPNPPAAWQPASLQDAFNRALPVVHRGLLRHPPDDLMAIVIQAEAGRGKARNLKPIPTPDAKESPAPAPTPTPAKAATAPESVARPSKIISAGKRSDTPTEIPPAQPEIPEPDSLAAATAPIEEPPHNTEARPSSSRSLSISEAVPDHAPPPDPSEKPLQPEKPPVPKKPRKPFWGPLLLTLGRALSSVWQQILYTSRALLTRVLPGNELFTIPWTTMAFIAIAVPAVIVTIASLVYLRRGRQSQFDTYVQYADAAALNAQGKSDPAEQYSAWEAVLFYVDKAEDYQSTDQTAALRAQAFQILDGLDGTERLDFQPAIVGGLGDDVNISQIVTSRDALYLLNANGGYVIRAWSTGRGYELDPTFRCGPGKYGAYIVGELIDLAPLPRDNSFGAEVVAMDANGILIYCIPEKPLLAAPLAPPDSNWGEPKSFILDNGTLYVLDPLTNAVWIYQGQDYTYVSRPRLFFTEEIPPMGDVLDLTINGSDLYLLNKDGHLTSCQYGFLDNPTQCTDAINFTDPRPGYENGPVIPGTQFTQILFQPPPGPSIYLMDAANKAIYQFSLRLTFQRQYRPAIPPDKPMTAFAFNLNREVFAAFENEVMIAPLP